MTGEDHDTDALIAALRSPALPSEQVGEDAAVTAMLGALSAVPARPTGHRSRRGVAIAAVTVASLGVGGLVAAGPGNFFSPAADRPSADRQTSTDAEITIRPVDDDADEPVEDEPAAAMPEAVPAGEVPDPGTPTSTIAVIDMGAVDGVTDEQVDDEDCEADDQVDRQDDRQDDHPDNHGAVVSDTARSTDRDGDVSDVARSDCTTPEPAGGPDDTPANTAPGRTGDTPANTAPGRTGDTPANTAPGRTDDNSANTTPGRPDDTGRP